MRRNVLLSFVFLLAGFSTAACAEEKADTLWVAVAFNNSGTHPIGEYHGLAKRSDYEALLAGNLKGFFTLQSAFSIKADTEQVIPLKDVSGYGYDGQISFRVETIVRVKTVRASFVEKLKAQLQAPDKTGPVELPLNAPDNSAGPKK